MSYYPEEKRLELGIKKLTSSVLRVINAVHELLKDGEGERRREIWEEVVRVTLAIEEIRKEITSLVLLLIARTQPLGVELVKMQSTISAVYDIYRISRYCRELMRIDFLLAPHSGISEIPGLREEFEKAKKAVEYALADLEKREPEHEDVVMRVDNDVDNSFENLLREVASSDIVKRDTALKLLAMRHIERIVDHAVYIESHVREARGA